MMIIVIIKIITIDGRLICYDHTMIIIIDGYNENHLSGGFGQIDM